MDAEGLQRRFDQLEVRVANLRAALETIRDLEPRREALEGTSMVTPVGYTDEIRRAAELALAQDDARIEAAE